MTLLLIGLLLSPQVAAPADGGADASIALYWQVNQAQLEIAADEWRARIQSAHDAAGDRARFAKDSAAITERFRAQRAALLAKYAVTELRFLQFASEHAAEIESYLEGNETLRVAITTLRHTIEGLVGQFDGAAAPLLAEAPQP